MRITVSTIIFGLPTGQRTVRTAVTLPGPTLAVRDLIAHKIGQEVVECTHQQRAGLSGEHLAPETLITTAPDRLAPATAATEICHAQRAFAARAFMIVIDDRRVVDPNLVVTLRPTTRIEFIKILPLVGG